MEKVDQIIHAGWIVTYEPEIAVLRNHALIIQSDKIHDILPSQNVNAKYTTDHTVNRPGHVLLPGFINAHTHSAMNIFRGLADDLELMDWLHNHIFPAESKWVSDELVYDASLLAVAEMIRGGTTCFNDMYFFLDATAKAAIQGGIRAHIGMTVIGVPTLWAKTTDEYFEKGIAFYHQYQHHPLIKPTMAPHSTYTLNPNELLRTKKIAAEFNLKTNIHLQEAPSEITQALATYHKRPLERLHEMGMVDSDMIAIHMTQLNEKDFDILKQTRPSIVHCPESNMKLVSGATPVAKLLDRGVNVALGTDGAASNNDLDMIGEMRTAAFLGKLTANDPKALPAETVLKMATIHGAKALGIDHLTGSLKPGKSADVIAIDMQQIETQPLYSVISQIVYSTNRQQVSDVWVKGKQLLADRQLLTLDEKAILQKTLSWRDKIRPR